MAGREHLFPLEQAADGRDALADGVLEEAAQLARILAQFRVGDERATALPTHDQVALDQPVHRRANRHAADAELPRELAFRGQHVAGSELAGLDTIGQLLLDLKVGGHAPTQGH